jgi:hypothetical protein
MTGSLRFCAGSRSRTDKAEMVCCPLPHGLMGLEIPQTQEFLDCLGGHGAVGLAVLPVVPSLRRPFSAHLCSSSGRYDLLSEQGGSERTGSRPAWFTSGVKPRSLVRGNWLAVHRGARSVAVLSIHKLAVLDDDDAVGLASLSWVDHSRSLNQRTPSFSGWGSSV